MSKKIFNKETIISSIWLVIYLSAFICLLVALPNKFQMMAFISTVVIFSCSVFTVFRPLISKDKIKVFDWVEIIVNLPLTILLISAYIASIQEDNLRNTLIPIVAATIGGLLTLFGVGITIKYNRLAKQEEYLRQIKPYIFVVSDLTWSSIAKDKKETAQILVNEKMSTFKDSIGEKKTYEIKYLRLGCSDISMCAFSGIVINKHNLIKFDFERILLKNSYVHLHIYHRFEFSEEIQSVELLLEDMLHNPYVAEARFTISEPNNGVSSILIESLYDIKESKVFIYD